MSFVTTLPSNCAPLISNEEKKTVGWASCANGCQNCMKCIPNKNTDCGQMLADAGFDCVPPACFAQCCYPVNTTSNTASNIPFTPIKPPEDPGEKWMVKYRGLIFLIIAASLAIIISLIYKK